MIKRSLLPDTVENYVTQITTAESKLVRDLRIETEKLPDAFMQLGPDQAALLAWLAQLIGTRRALEIGTFTGLSALVVAQTLPPDGRLIACDISKEWTTIGRPYWEKADVAKKIDLRIGPATETLKKLEKEFGQASFDFALIDADKISYDTYYEACLRLIRPNGVMVLDNMLQNGKVTNKQHTEEAVQSIKTLNQKIKEDPRVSAVLLTVGDGMTIVRRR
jgi:O-methyltransferase